MLTTGILTTESVRSDGDEGTRPSFADLADSFEPFFVFVFDIPNYSNLPVCPAAHTVSLGDLTGDSLP